MQAWEVKGEEGIFQTDTFLSISNSSFSWQKEKSILECQQLDRVASLLIGRSTDTVSGVRKVLQAKLFKQWVTKR